MRKIGAMPPSCKGLASAHGLGTVSLALVLLLSGVGFAAELSGDWHGNLTGDKGMFEIDVTFSPQGYLVFTYTNNSGRTRTVELTEAGQQIQYVPPGGGVKTHVVDSLVRGPGRLSLVLRSTFERTSGNYLDQEFMSESFDFVLSSEGLATRYAGKSTSYFSGTGAAASQDETIAAGVLQKVN
jgi:hypothetical protein